MISRLILIILLCLPVSPVLAEYGDFYWLPKVGAMAIQINDANPMSAAGVNIGLGLDPNFSMEFETLYGLKGGEYQQSGLPGRFHVASAGLYGVARVQILPGFYTKGRLGVLFEEVSNRYADEPVARVPYVGLSGGLGVGVSLQKFTAELEWTQIEKNIAAVVFGIHYPLSLDQLQ